MDDILSRLKFIKDLLKDDIDYSLHKSGNKIIKIDKNFSAIIKKICQDKLIYVKSGSSGHTFRGVSRTNENVYVGIKVVAYHKKSKYGNPDVISRPENAELMMIKLLSKFVINYSTPHIVLPILTFDTNISLFIKLNTKEIVTNKKYIQFVERYNNDEYFPKVSILISEWANGGDFLDFIKKHYKKMELLHWKVFFFQIISVLAVIQSKYPSFRHNDLKANNLLIQKVKHDKKKILYEINDVKYIVPNVNYNIMLWDYDFACIPGVVDNDKVSARWTNKINVKPKMHRYYDMHYFFNTLVSKGFFPQLLLSSSIDQSIKDFYYRIVPEQYRKHPQFISERGRLLIDHEYLLPDDVLKNDPLFECFRGDFQNV